MRRPTFTLVNPSPIGVVTGPFSATLLRRIESSSSPRQRRAVLLDRERRRRRDVSHSIVHARRLEDA